MDCTYNFIPQNTGTKIKENEILASDNSGDAKYVILGRWVFGNMKFNINYVGRDMSIDEILSKLVGVWIMKNMEIINWKCWQIFNT